MYPKEFSLQHQAQIEAEKIRAANRLSNSRNSIVDSAFGSTEAPMQKALRQYVLDVFTVFSSVACELGRSGKWSALEVEKQSWQFICNLAIQAEQELGYDYRGKLVTLTDYQHRLLSAHAHAFRESTEWQVFQSQRLDVALHQAQTPTISDPISTPKPQQAVENPTPPLTARETYIQPPTRYPKVVGGSHWLRRFPTSRLRKPKDP